MNKIKTYICGCAKDVGCYLDDVFNNIGFIGQLFDDFHIIIYYDESDDNTLVKLNEYYEYYQSKMTVLIGEYPLTNVRTQNPLHLIPIHHNDTNRLRNLINRLLFLVPVDAQRQPQVVQTLVLFLPHHGDATAQMRILAGCPLFAETINTVIQIKYLLAPVGISGLWPGAELHFLQSRGARTAFEIDSEPPCKATYCPRGSQA